MSNNDKTVDLTGKATVKDEVVDLGKNATVDGETVIIKESEDGTITIEGDGIRVENGDLYIDNPNYEIKGETLIIHKNRSK
ncbi:MAG: hypothetical protein J6P28_08745 [Treponema sp.]|nr:hypothetical protein [Treponema sp.]